MSGSSGWMAQEQYDKMEAVALAKKPEDREPWEVRYLESLDEMLQAEIENRHWSYYWIFRPLGILMLLCSVGQVICLVALIVLQFKY